MHVKIVDDMPDGSTLVVTSILRGRKLARSRRNKAALLGLRLDTGTDRHGYSRDQLFTSL
jgi:hypothetical protein